MARFDIYQNPDALQRKSVPYWLDVQNSFLEIETRVVVPLKLLAQFKVRVPRLNPTLTVAGVELVMDTSALGAVPVSELRRNVGNQSLDQPVIQEALDVLFGGY